MEEKDTQNVPVPQEGGNKLLVYVNKNIPELSESSDDEKYSAIVELLEKTRAFNENMEALFKAEPHIGALLGGMMKGKKSFLGSMADIMTPEEYGEALNSEGGDAILSRNERLNKLQAYEDKQGIIEKNIADTQQNIESWLDEKGWPAEKVQDFSTKIGQLFDIMSDGVLSKNELDALERMIYFDDMITSAREEGELLGRNAKIDTSRLEKAAATTTDGLPGISGGGAVVETPTEGGYFDDVISQAAERQRRLKGE